MYNFYQPPTGLYYFWIFYVIYPLMKWSVLQYFRALESDAEVLEELSDLLANNPLQK